MNPQSVLGLIAAILLIGGFWCTGAEFGNYTSPHGPRYGPLTMLIGLVLAIISFLMYIL